MPSPDSPGTKHEAEKKLAPGEATEGMGETGPPPDPATGSHYTAKGPRQLAHFRIVRQLGAGGMGTVYEAHDSTLDRRVALKVMQSKSAESSSSRERFLREAKAAAAVKHDHIVTIYFVGDDHGIPFIAMEFLHGTPLDAWLKSNRPSIEQAIRIARQTADGLAGAHEYGLIHRDIKPANLWLESPKNRVKILDFGLARPTSDDTHLTREGAIVGTPAFMSPEQARGGTIDHRTDLFSLGVVLYRMLTGAMPFTGPNTMAILTSLAVDTPVPVCERNPDVPALLGDLVHRLLSKDPAGRPAKASDVATELRQIDRLMAGSPVASGPMPVVVAMPPQAAQTYVEANPFELPGESSVMEMPPVVMLPAETASSLKWWLVGGGVGIVAAVGLGFLVLQVLKKPTVSKTDTQPVKIATTNPAVDRSGNKSKARVRSAEEEKQRKAAETLLRYVKIGISTGKFTRKDLTPGQPLPDEAFEITSISTTPGLDKEDVKHLILDTIGELESFRTILGGHFNYLNLGPEDLHNLADRPAGKSIVSLQLGGLQLSDDVLAAVKRFPNLGSLTLGATFADDSLLARFAADPPPLKPTVNGRCSLNLVGLNHKLSNVTSTGLLLLVKLPYHDITFAPAVSEKNLSIFNEDFCRGLAANPRTFRLHIAPKNDGCLAELAKHSGLRNLQLGREGVTDAGLKYLKPMVNLRDLKLERTPGVTEGGVRDLARALPKLKITWAGGVILPRDNSDPLPLDTDDLLLEFDPESMAAPQPEKK